MKFMVKPGAELARTLVGSSCAGASQAWLWLKKTVLQVNVPKGLNGGGLWRPALPRLRGWWRQRLWGMCFAHLWLPISGPWSLLLLLLLRQFGAALVGKFPRLWLPFLAVDSVFWCRLPGGPHAFVSFLCLLLLPPFSPGSP